MLLPAFPPSVPAAAIVERLEAARSQSGGAGVVAFDGDGTLWEGDIGNELFAALLASGGVRVAALGALRETADRVSIDAGGTPTELAERLFASYLRGLLPEDETCAMMAWAFAGYTESEAWEFANHALARAGLRDRLQRELAPVQAWAQATSGVDVWVVSASPRCIVEPAAALVCPAARVLAATPVLERGAYASRVECPLPYGDGKAQALTAAAPGARVLGVFGDNSFDVAMLKLADVPVAVRPKAALTARAHEVPGLVTIVA